MFITKIFHLHQPLHEARQRLREFELGDWTSSDEDAELRCSAIEAEGIGRFELTTPGGYRVHADIQEVPGEEPNRILFRSVHGDIEMAGMVELFPVRPNLTEVSITVDYEPASPLQKVFGTLDRFLNRQLARVEACMERARSVSPQPAVALPGRFA